MSEDQFTKLFKYMQTEFNKMHVELESKASTKLVERVIEILDEDAKQPEIDEHERAALSLQVNRLEKRIATLEKKLA